MSALVRSSTAVAVTGFTIAAFAVAPGPLSASLPLVSHDIRLSAATVPPGGLITSFLGNQVVYCKIVCGAAIADAINVADVALQLPATFVTALQSDGGNLFKALGAASASVTGSAEAGAADIIFKDGMEVAPRAVNAIETGVVGLLNVFPAAANGLPGIIRALEAAQAETFTALNLPIVADPIPTVMPKGALEVGVVGALNVVASVAVTGLNDVLVGVIQVPNAVAQTLALTGNPLRALGAGFSTAATVVSNIGNAIAASVRTAVDNVRTALGQTQKATTTTTPAPVTSGTSNALVSATRQSVRPAASTAAAKAVVSTTKPANASTSTTKPATQPAATRPDKSSPLHAATPTAGQTGHSPASHTAGQPHAAKSPAQHSHSHR